MVSEVPTPPNQEQSPLHARSQQLALPLRYRLRGADFFKKCYAEGSKHIELNVIIMKEHIMTTTDTYSIVIAATVLIMIVTMAA